MDKKKDKNFNRIRVIDLFSGAGGLTFGFYFSLVNGLFQKGNDFEIIFANDFSCDACNAFKSNYKDVQIFETSIENVTESFLNSHGVDFSNIDLIIGGPPCQSYSTIGKRKNDDRSKMYIEYRRILSFIKPRMFIFENVLGILSFRDENGNKIMDLITDEFSKLGYDIQFKVLNSKDYGVPENRLRVFLVGTLKGENIIWNYPKPFLTEPITLKEAINDLPIICPNEKVNFYTSKPTNIYQQIMRGTVNNLTEHFYKGYSERLTRIISNLGYGETHDDINKKVINGDLPPELFLSSGYNNSYGRLVWEKPCATITNNFGTPSSNRCIHPTQNRALTIREAARIQSFPDFFIFKGTDSSKRKQIGNAVPPLLSIELAKCVCEAFGEKYGK